MAMISSEDQIFFVYDHTSLQREEDDLKDAIVYFYPKTINIQRQCSYCGQLMGLVGFFESIIDSPPIVYTLAKNKFAVKRLGKFSLALAGSHMDPNSVILNQLEYLSNLLRFYQHSLQKIEMETASRKEMISSMSRMWDCYWPFVRRYGDNMAAAFEALPKLDLPKSCSIMFLEASHLLQYCQRPPHVLGGCIMFKSRILLSQFDAVLTSKLLLIKPQQANLPCIKIDLDFPCPQGVRLLSVYLSADEYLKLAPNAILIYEGQETQEPQTDLHHSEVAEILREATSECEVTTPTEPAQSASLSEECCEMNLKTSAELREELGQAMESNSSEGTPQVEDDLSAGITTAVDVTSVSLDQTMPKDSQQQLEVADLVFEEQNLPKSERQSQESCDTNSPPPVSKESLGSIDDDCFPTVEIHSSMVGNSDSSEVKSSASSSENTEWKSVIKKPPKQLSFKSSDLFRNVQMAAARGSKALYRNPAVSMEAETLSSSCKASKSDVTDKIISTTEQQIKEISSVTDGKGTGIVDSSDTSPQSQSSGVDTSSPTVVLTDKTACPENLTCMGKRSRAEKSNDAIKRTAVVDAEGLVEADLYVQGHGDIAIILIMEKGKARHTDTLRSMWSDIVTQLGDLDLRLKESDKLKQKEMAKGLPHPLPYNYLLFDNFIQSLEGQISVSGSDLRPMSSRDHHFCETSVRVHEEFRKHPSLMDITLRHSSGSVCGRSTGVRELFFQSSDPLTSPGAPTEKDPALSLEEWATQTMYSNQGLHLL